MITLREHINQIEKLRVTSERMTKVVITPECARFVLSERHGRNRSIRNEKVNALAHDIKRGGWRPSMSPITFSLVDMPGTKAIRQDLTDGQHRVSAIVKADQAITAWVGTSGNPEAIVDEHAKRTLVDELKMRGIKNPTAVAYTIKLLYCFYEKGIEMYKRGIWSFTLSNASALDFFDQHREIEDSVDYCKKHVKGPQIKGRVSIVSAIHYHCTQKLQRHDIANSFVTQIGDGLQLGATSPVLHTRNFILFDDMAPGHIKTVRLNAATIIGFNAFFNNEKIKSMNVMKKRIDSVAKQELDLKIIPEHSSFQNHNNLINSNKIRPFFGKKKGAQIFKRP